MHARRAPERAWARVSGKDDCAWTVPSLITEEAPQVADVRSEPVQAPTSRCSRPIPSSRFSTALRPRSAPPAVLDAQRRFYETMNANPLRGLYGLSVAATEAIDDVRAPRRRASLARLDARGRRLRAATRARPSTSWPESSPARSCSVRATRCAIIGHGAPLQPHPLAAGLRAHAGAHLVYLLSATEGSGGRLHRSPRRSLRRRSAPRTKIVAAAHVSNVHGGRRTPVRKPSPTAAHEAGALMVVDAAQSVPHIPVDVERARLPTSLAFSGPQGSSARSASGVLWGRHELLDEMPPVAHRRRDDRLRARAGRHLGARSREVRGGHAGRRRHLRHRRRALLPHRDRGARRGGGARGRARVPRRSRASPSLAFVDLIGPEDPARRARRRQLQRARRAPARRGEHPRRVTASASAPGHHCAQPLLAWLGVENLACCRAEPRVLQRHVRRRPPR